MQKSLRGERVPKAKKASDPVGASYWEEPWREGVPPEPAEPGTRREAAEMIVYEKNPLGTVNGAFYRAPLGRTYIDGPTLLAAQECVAAASRYFRWFDARVRSCAKNSPSEFLRMYATVEGRVRLMCAGLRLYDDDGEIVDARGYPVIYAGHYPGLNEPALWRGDVDQEPVDLGVERVSVRTRETV